MFWHFDFLYMRVMRVLKRFGASQERAFGAKYTRYGNGRFAFQTQAVERLPDQRSILHTGLLLRLHTLYIEQPFVTLSPNEEYNPSSDQSNDLPHLTSGLFLPISVTRASMSVAYDCSRNEKSKFATWN